jgi:pyruvate/2-oxoglutarate dehydrogenase complex dihydrolipoamide dehydrogenase (E3) component
MRDDAVFERSRRVAVDRVRGLRLLMRKNNIDEYEGQGIFVERHTMRIKGQHIDTQINFDAVIIATGATPAAAAQFTLAQRWDLTVEEQRPHPPDLVGSAAGNISRPGWKDDQLLEHSQSILKATARRAAQLRT